MRRTLWVTVIVLLLGSAVASCDRSTAGTGSTATSADPPTATAMDITMEGTPVYGSTTCRITSRGGETRDDREILEEHFSCLDEMSDPRVSGSDEIDVRTVYLAGHEDLAAPWTAELVLSNDQGSWRGTCTGALESTSDPNGGPTNYGICTLAGEGAYADLSYTYLVAGGNADLRYAGWIEPAP